MTLEQKYQKRYKEITKRYRKERLIKTAIMFAIALGSGIATYILYQKSKINDNGYFIITGVICIGMLFQSLTMPFHTSKSETEEINQLNQAYENAKMMKTD